MINGELLIAYAWWEGKEGWNHILETNTWPPDTAILTAWKVKNTGNESAVFKTRLLGVESAEAWLTPGATFSFEYPAISLSPGTHQFTLEIIAAAEVVAEYPFEVATSVAVPDWMSIIAPILVLGLLAGLMVPMMKGVFK